MQEEQRHLLRTRAAPTGGFIGCHHAGTLCCCCCSHGAVAATAYVATAVAAAAGAASGAWFEAILEISEERVSAILTSAIRLLL